MDIKQAAELYTTQFEGFNLGTGLPAPEKQTQAMQALVTLAASAEVPDNKYQHLDQIVAAVAELAPKSAVVFNQEIVENPARKETAKALELALTVMEKRSPETWKHVVHHMALTMSYYEHQTGLDKPNTLPDNKELLTLFVGALGHDFGKVALDPRLLHKSTRVEAEKFTKALEEFRARVPDYPEKLHDTIFLEEANAGKIIFADPGAPPPAAKPLILDIGKDMRRSEEYWVDGQERARHNAIWERIGAKAKASIPQELWLSDADQKTLTMSKRGTVTPEEMSIISTHDNMSEAFFAAAPLPPELADVKNIVSMDRFLRKGAEPAPVLADIVHTADVFEAITGDRAYRKPYKYEEAITVLEGMGRDGKVNPALVQSMETNGTLMGYAEAVGMEHSPDLQKSQSPLSWVRRLTGGKDSPAAAPVVWTQSVTRTVTGKGAEI